MTSTNRSQASHGSGSRGSRHRSRPPTCPDENELVLLADGALADNRRASIDRHLDGCAPCTLLVAELAGMAAPVRPVPARYKVIRQLGAGAMGIVWEAEDKHLGRRVALKFVRADKTHETATGATAAAHRERRTRLFREARALAQLRHRNVVSVYDVGESADELFLALELVIGMDARTWRAAQPRTTDEVLAVWRQAAAGLAAVHRAGIVHRDIKPDNILVAEDGRVLVGDFGLATDHHTTTAGHARQPVLTNQHLTATGAIVGTPIYMAYEQLVGEPATQKSDQYALCASIWEALAGERPFTGPTLGAIAMAMQQRPVVPASRRASEGHVFAALVRGLDPNPAKRWPNIEALLTALDTSAARRSPAKSRAIWLALGAASVAAAATVGVLAWRDRAGSSAGSSLDATKRDANVERLGDATPTEREASPRRDSSTSESSTPNRQASDHEMRKSARTASPVEDVRRANASDALHAGASKVATASSPVPAPVTQSDWKRMLDRATDKLGFGEGRVCLQLLASMPPVPAVMEEQAETLRAMCTMKAGDCAGGRALLEAAGRANGWDPVRLDEALRTADFTYCPLDAGPRTAWVDRAKFRLLYAAGAKASCQPVLAFIAKHGLQLPDQREQLLLETTCRFNAGDCTGARITWRKSFALGETDPTRIAEREQVADTVFVQTFPSCP